MTRTSKILAACLLVSLCINGALTGFLIAKGGFFGHHLPPGVTSLGELFRRTPPDVRDRLKSAFQEARREARSDWQAARSARGRVAEILQREPLDEQALRQALAAVRQATSEAQDVFQEAFFRTLRELTPDQRRRLGEAWAAEGPGASRE